MATVLNKDPVTYQKERNDFIRELLHFHETRGTPFRRVPQINGHEIDLYLLYVLVTAHGGWFKVNSRNEWDTLMEQFRLPKNCVNSGVALKQVYLRYLDRYEKAHFLGEDGGRASDDDEDSRHKRWSARALHSVPLTYNHTQHVITESQRTHYNLSTDLFRASDYDRLALSLISPLPNEQDFALNVCTLLSNEGRHTLKLDKCPRLIDFLLAHAAVFNHESLRELFQEVYGKVRHSSMSHFWRDVLEDPELYHVADETRWPQRKSKEDVVGVVEPSSSRSLSQPATRPASPSTPASPSNSLTVSQPPTRVSSPTPSPSVDPVNRTEAEESVVRPLVDLDECAMDVDYERRVSREVRDELGDDADVRVSDEREGRCKSKQDSKTKMEIDSSDLELFCLGRTMGTQDMLGQRVLQVANIIRNLSFQEENMPLLAGNQSVVRFLLLCLGSRWDSLRQLGLDTLGNIAAELSLERLSSDPLLQLVLGAVTARIAGPDRAGVIGALEVLNRIGQREDSEEVLQRVLDQEMYVQICRYLTLHDIMLLVHTLECLYSLSSLGERACNCIVRVHGLIDTLVSLITVEAQSYGPKACILMRVVETVSGPGYDTYPAPNLSQPVMHTMTPTMTPVEVHSTHHGAPMHHSVHPVQTDVMANAVPMHAATAPHNAVVSPTMHAAVHANMPGGVAASPYGAHTPAVLGSMSPYTPSAAQGAHSAVASSISTTPVGPPNMHNAMNNYSAAKKLFPPSPVPNKVFRRNEAEVCVPYGIEEPRVPVPLEVDEQRFSTQMQQTPQGARLPIQPQPNFAQQDSSKIAMDTTREGEQFACSFLQNTYFACSGVQVAHSEVYNNYVGACSKAGQKCIITPALFAKCVRAVFGPSTSIADQGGTIPVVPLNYIGLKMRPENAIGRVVDASKDPSVLGPTVTAEEVVARENEQFASAFLRASYMTCAGAQTTHLDMYNNYLAACTRAGRKGVPSHIFPKCVKAVFGAGSANAPVVAVPDQACATQVPLAYDGIKVRAQLLSANVASPVPASAAAQPKARAKCKKAGLGPKAAAAAAAAAGVVSSTSESSSPGPVSIPATPSMSPILQAQLSAPSKPKDSTSTTTTTPTVESASQVLAHPHLSHALLGGDSGTSTAPTPVVKAASPGPLQGGGQSAPQGTSTSTSTPTSSASPVLAAPVASAQPPAAPQVSVGTAASPNTSLIKSLLATKVGEAGTVSPASCSMQSAGLTNVVSAHSLGAASFNSASGLQVAQRQRLQQQQQQQQVTSIQAQTAPVCTSTEQSSQPAVSEVAVPAQTAEQSQQLARVQSPPAVPIQVSVKNEQVDAKCQPLPDTKPAVKSEVQADAHVTPPQQSPPAPIKMEPQTPLEAVVSQSPLTAHAVTTQTQIVLPTVPTAQIQAPPSSQTQTAPPPLQLQQAMMNNKGKAIRVARINGARSPAIIQISEQMGSSVPEQPENHLGGKSTLLGRRDPPQPPPPPLAPLSSGSGRPAECEANSVIKGPMVVAAASDGTSSAPAEGALVNGMPHGAAVEIEEDGVKRRSSMMLEDLLEKSVDVKEPPVLNGGVPTKDLRIGDHGLELVARPMKPEVGKQIRINERGGLEVVDNAVRTGECDPRRTAHGAEVTDKSAGTDAKESAVPIVDSQQDLVLRKELSVGEKLLQFLEKQSQEGNLKGAEEVDEEPVQSAQAAQKRPLSDPTGSEEAKRPRLEVNGNGVGSREESPDPDGEKVKASSSAANLYAALAASALEDEDEIMILPQETPAVPQQPALPAAPVEAPVQPQPQPQPHLQLQAQLPSAEAPQIQLVQTGAGIRPMLVGHSSTETPAQVQQVVTSQPQQSQGPTQQPQVMVAASTCQIILSQGQLGGQGLICTGGQLTAPTAAATIKTAQGIQAVPVLVPAGMSCSPGPQGVSAQVRPQAMMLQQSGNPTATATAQFVVSQAHGLPQSHQVQLVQSTPGGQMQLVASGAPGGPGSSPNLVMAQQQTAVVQGQTQTVLVVQMPQQQGSAGKTIIILQPQQGQVQAQAQAPGQAMMQSQPQIQQKVLAMTPQGQQVVVTQVPRPVVQTPTLSHTPPPALVAASPCPSPVIALPTSSAAPSSVAVSMSAATITSTAALTPSSTANGVQVSGLAVSMPTGIPTSVVTANPNAVGSASVQASVIRPGGATSPCPSAQVVPKVEQTPSTVATPTRMGTRSTYAKINAATQPAVVPGTATVGNAQAGVNMGVLPGANLRPGAGTPDHSIFLCEWRGCMRSFRSAKEVFFHACVAHCPSGNQEMQCLWERCDAMKRKRFSLMTHLYERHCNTEVLRMMAVRRRQLSQSGHSEIPPPQPPTPHPGYAPNAAFHAIKRHALEYPKELLLKPGPCAAPAVPEQDDNEGPVTKSIRLTAALILRNLVIYSNAGRRLLRRYEPHLASVALSNVESSRTVAQVLYDMNNTSGSR